MRADGRKPDELRKVTIRKGYLKSALGSCLIEMGDTKVLCTASIEDKVPLFLKNKGKGWLTAEYGMLPASCSERVPRETARGGPSGRTQEIQRLIGRSLRAVVDLGKIGEKSFWVDTDVIQGDGGTRTVAITGGFIALMDAMSKAIKEDRIATSPIHDYIAAVSVGMVQGEPLLDLCYTEDMSAEVDMNVVMTGSGKFVEIQGTAENNPFSKKELDEMVGLAKKGIRELIDLQEKHVQL